MSRNANWKYKMVELFIIMLAVIQIGTMPIMYAEASFTVFTVAVCLLIIGTIAFYLFFNRKCWEFSRHEINLAETVQAIGVLLLIGVQIWLYIRNIRPSTDDAFYLSWMTSVIDTNRLYPFDPSTGLEWANFDISYNMVAYELVAASISRVTGISVPVLCHTIYPVFFLIIHYLLMQHIFERLFPKMKWFAQLLWCLTNLFGGFAPKSFGMELLGHLWHGKIVFRSILIPFMFLLFYELYEERNIDGRSFLILIACLYAGFHLSTIGIYMGPILYMCLASGTLFFKKSIKYYISIVIPVLCCIPFLLIRYIQFFHRNDRFNYFTDKAEELEWVDALIRTSGNWIFIVLWIAALITILLFAQKN